MNKLLKFILFIGCFFCISSLSGQEILKEVARQVKKDSERLKEEREVSAVVIDGDTVPNVYLQPFYIFEQRTFASKKEKKRYNRLQYNVKVVYPYAKKAGELLRKYEAEMDTILDEKIKRKYYKKVEEELLAEYEEELKKMTISQGRILIKLIDRETSRTSYELVKNLRSGFTAFFWQGLARLFGHNLKSEYLAEEEDKYIEEIILALEQNQL